MPRGGRRAHDVPGAHPPVLVADSDAGARRVFASVLERFGFQVFEAATGEEALALTEQCAPRLTVAELTLPRDDAFQAYVRLHRIPYIVTVATEYDAVPANAVVVLEKPFSLTVLLQEVFRIVRTHGNTPVAA